MCISSIIQEEMTTWCSWNNRNIMYDHTTVKQCPISLKISTIAVLDNRITNMKKFYVYWHTFIKYSWSLCWFLCWSELVWHGFDNVSLFHEYLISGLTMNANNLGFKPHYTHNVIILLQKGETSILFPSWVMASYSFFTSPTFLMNI